MQTITLTRILESESLPELRPFVGREVEITIRETSATKPITITEKSPSPLAGSVLEYDDPFGPAVPPEEWEANL